MTTPLSGHSSRVTINSPPLTGSLVINGYIPAISFGPFQGVSFIKMRVSHAAQAALCAPATFPAQLTIFPDTPLHAFQSFAEDVQDAPVASALLLAAVHAHVEHIGSCVRPDWFSSDILSGFLYILTQQLIFIINDMVIVTWLLKIVNRNGK
jgi:hypothetical protein